VTEAIGRFLVRNRARLADLSARARRATADALVRRRVTLGFVVAGVALVLARPTWATWSAGLAVACAGEAIRIWAAGHLQKGREVTRSGPYRWTRHPLYVGSAIIALGVVIGARSALVALLGAAYIGITIPMAIRSEESFLQRTFGTTYDLYRRDEAPPMMRRFSLAHAWRNREYRAVLGLAGGFAILAAKLLLSI
jgi:protein-S-isoprenylcysteine O-methyltransferase Ste14